jgi:hydroxypyruvate isomerase
LSVSDQSLPRVGIIESQFRPRKHDPGLSDELDDNQEINHPPIMRKLVDIRYKGFVGHEFIPTRDALTGLKQAVSLCDV